MTKQQSSVGVADSTLEESLVERRSEQLADRGLFLKKFLAKGRTISAAVPSSRSLVDSVLRAVDFSRPSTIVELGAGTGVITEQILERLQPHHRFVTVENDPDFCEIIRRRFPEVTLLETDVAKIAEPLARLGIQKVDYVLSGLPTPNLPRRTAISILRWLRANLAPNGQFVQITVAPLVYRAFYKRLFESVTYRMVWRNFPPGGVYYCKRPRTGKPLKSR